MMHAHAEGSCMEVFVLEGEGGRFQEFAESLRGTRSRSPSSIRTRGRTRRRRRRSGTPTTGTGTATRGTGTRGRAAEGPVLRAFLFIALLDGERGRVDGGTALIAVWYFTLRGRFPALVRGALFEDMRVRQKQALQIHDNIVQGIVKAKLSTELGQTETAKRELEGPLAASRKIP